MGSSGDACCGDQEEKMKMSEAKNGHIESPSDPPTLPKQNATPKLLFATFAAVVGSAFQHGYNTGVTNAPEKLIKNWLSDLQNNNSLNSGGNGLVPQTATLLIWSTIVSIFCIGGMVGGLSAAFVTETMGRKWAIVANNVLVFISALLMGLARSNSSYWMLIFGRLIIGVNAGLNAGLIPMYLSEIAPIHLRGMIGSSYQLIITISILVSQILGMQSILGNEDGWPTLLSLIVVPAILQLVTMPFCAESPKYLWSIGREQSALEALRWLRGTTDVQSEMKLIKSEFDTQKSAPRVTLGQMLINPMLRIPLIIAVVIMLAQQLSGINAVIFYSTSIMEKAELSPDMAQVGTIVMGSMNVVMTVISSLLVEAAGRKTLLLIGFGGLLINTLLLTFCLVLSMSTGSVVMSYMSAFFVIAFVMIFAIGPGSIPWFLVTELFMQNARPLATSVAVGVNWGANFFVGLGFPLLVTVMDAYVFIIFAALQTAFILFIMKKVPETKNKTTEEISAVFRQMSYE